ncbi:unnamed protein product [Camellia sinensis]
MGVIFALKVYLDLDLLGMGFLDSMVLDVPRVRAMAIDIAKMPLINRAKGEREVESAPAIVFLKKHGIKPVVYHGPANNSCFVDIMEQNKHQGVKHGQHPLRVYESSCVLVSLDIKGLMNLILPQLRSVTSMELGCDARGYSRAGNETAIWYCVILAGRSSPELNKMHARIQEALSTVDKDQPSSLAAVALKEKRLIFTWLDGEAQQVSPFVCQVGITIVGKGYQKNGHNFLMRYTLVLLLYVTKGMLPRIVLKLRGKKPKNMLEAFLNDDVDPASQLLVRYNGSEESSDIWPSICCIIKWISQIIKDGDSRELPFFRIGSIMNGIHNRLGDQRIGLVFLLEALMSFGSIWLRRSQSTHPSQSNNQTQLSKKR